MEQEEQPKETAFSQLEHQKIKSERVLQETSYMLNTIREVFGDETRFLGDGATAEVYELPFAPYICVKYIADQGAYEENNNLEIEYDYLRASNNLTTTEEAHVRTPRADFIRIDPVEGHQLGQERVKGKTLADIMNNPLIETSAKLIELSRTIDRASLFHDSEEFINRLYSEYGITHNHLTEQNLMLDERGRLYIIDFGKAMQITPENNLASEHALDVEHLELSIKNFFSFIDGQTTLK